jgi:hypothetical protein
MLIVKDKLQKIYSRFLNTPAVYSDDAEPIDLYFNEILAELEEIIRFNCDVQSELDRLYLKVYYYPQYTGSDTQAQFIDSQLQELGTELARIIYLTSRTLATCDPE